jgi:hypothetical protein
MLSYHRTEPAATAVLLMDQSCILGPGAHCHVVCRNWSRPLVLYRQQSQLRCRADEPLEIDGTPCGRQGTVTLRSRVRGSDFCLNLEPVETACV